MLKPTYPALQAAALTLSIVLAPAAAGQDAPSRDTGVGKEIAAQGNRALQLIKAEARAAVKALLPVLPAAPRVVKASLPGGSTVAMGAATRCDQ